MHAHPDRIDHSIRDCIILRGPKGCWMFRVTRHDGTDLTWRVDRGLDALDVITMIEYQLDHLTAKGLARLTEHRALFGSDG